MGSSKRAAWALTVWVTPGECEAACFWQEPHQKASPVAQPYFTGRVSCIARTEEEACRRLAALLRAWGILVTPQTRRNRIVVPPTGLPVVYRGRPDKGPPPNRPGNGGSRRLKPHAQAASASAALSEEWRAIRARLTGLRRKEEADEGEGEGR
jgi:hypothetical protein